MENYPKLRKFIGTAIAIFFLTISLSYITVSCSSSTVSPPSTTQTESSSSDNSPSPTPETIVEQCSIDTSGILADLQNANRFIDEIQLRKELRFPVIQGQSIYSRVASDPNCKAEKEQLRFVLQTSWQRYLTASYNVGQLLSVSNKGLCSAGCPFASASDSCEIQCDQSYQSELERLARERNIGDQEMRGFFGN